MAVVKNIARFRLILLLLLFVLVGFGLSALISVLLTSPIYCRQPVYRDGPNGSTAIHCAGGPVVLVPKEVS